jgi:Domain of unknown function (DUF4388)
MEQQGRILDGNLETLGLQATLKMLALSGKTGVLHVSSGQERLAIFLDNGHIVDLDEPGTPLPDLIDMFRLLGRLSRSQALDLRSAVAGNVGAALEYLRQVGVVSPAEVQQRTEFRVIQAISRAIRWERGRFEFHRDIASIQARAGTMRPLNVDHILLEALKIADEWGRASSLALSRNTVARWMPEFTGDVTKLGLGREEVHVLCLSNGQFPLHAVAYALLVPEPLVAEKVQRLLELGLVEVVDARLEAELERSLVNLLGQSQHQLSLEGRSTPEARMLMLVRAMGACINGLLVHHATYARLLRGRGEVSRAEVMRYLDAAFQPLLATLQREYPRMDEVLRFADGKFDFHDIETFDRVVRGQELAECYWDAVQLCAHFTRLVFDRVLSDEVGKSRAGRQFEDMWAEFFREIDEEIARLGHRRAAQRAQSERAGPARNGAGGNAAQAAFAVPYQTPRDAQGRFN